MKESWRGLSVSLDFVMDLSFGQQVRFTWLSTR